MSGGEFDNDTGEVEGTKTATSTLPCAQCGAELEFHPGQAQLKCGYCGHTQTIAVQADAAVIEYDLEDAMARFLGQAMAPPPSGFREIKCNDCGAEIQVAASAETARCDYCGSRSTLQVELPQSVLQPESMLPFALDGARAEELFRAWLKGLWFRPNALKSRSSVEDLHGVYAPFWTYDSNVAARWTAQAGYYYYVSETYRDSEGKTQTRQVRKIRWRWTSGHRKDFFDDWLVCASQNLNRGELAGLLKKVEPFPTKQLVPYDEKFLAGFRAERYSIDLKAGWGIARQGMYDEVKSRCGRDVPGDTHRFLEVRASFFGQSFKLILLPIFVLAYRFQDKTYNVLVNGVTGEVQGKAPLSWVKILLLVLAILAVVGGGYGLFVLLGSR